MITADQHTHSSFSTDSTEPLIEMAKAAADRGLRTICLTEHLDYDYPGGEFQLDTAAYREELMCVKSALSDKVEVLFGVELGVMDYLAPRLNEFAAAWDFDFIIGSSHLVDGKDPYYPEYFETLGSKNGILRYFESILANIRAFDNFDVYGHLDYVVRYSPEKKYEPLDYREMLDEILKALISRGKGIEVNTAGIASGMGYPHPNAFILRRYKELGGEIVTVGSDAHDRMRVAADFDKAQAALEAAGFERYAVFRHGMAEFVKL
ncbi:MAG: histidinol-phosphatase HisJ family protein [Ruminococcaceae bacterium]|nr:histidinol-phosphatase HisJ family protein [Oscillospiraceae bacterium]